MSPCLANMNILAVIKIGALRWASKIEIQNGDFLENCCNDFDHISIVYGDHLPVWNRTGGIFRYIGTGNGRPKVKVDLIKTRSTGRMDFVVVRYSATNNGLPSNSRFSFQGNVVRAIRM
jgi:hypothetical protein